MSTKSFREHFENTITDQGRELVFSFYVAFSRFESALKNSITYANGNERKVTANWDLFTSQIKEVFDMNKTPELNEAVTFLLKSPPKIQILENGQLGWRTRTFDENTGEINKLRLHICDTRNNLFHGGKFNGIFEPAVSRNYKLIDACIKILDKWLILSDEVNENFNKEMG